MNKFNYLDIDGKLLHMLLVVLEKQSVTKAAEELNLTQSAVSHALDKLRVICKDPLFVKSGRNISPTERAKELALQARAILDQLEIFSQASIFNPQELRTSFTIAANDLQRDFLLPPLLKHLEKIAPHIIIKVIPSGIPSLQMLRDQDCQLAITPRPPDGADIYHKRLFTDEYVIFYDKTARKAPKNLSEYLSSQHISVAYDPPRPLAIDQFLLDKGIRRNFKVLVPGFAGIPAFLKSNQLLATLPSLSKAHLLKDFETCPPPFKCPTMPMYMVWHDKYQRDPTQKWLREQLELIVTSAFKLINKN
jgi:DNA-binding transcriptional LysR family regulator